MIGKVSKGSDTAGLLRYLFGPGRANEHTDQHLVAAWDQQDLPALQPERVGNRYDVRALADLLDQPLAALPRQPTSTVWHCSLRTAPGDKRLTDAEWADAARAVLDHVELAPAGDTDGCRWVAVRHADDHIHVLATLARQDGRGARTSHDFRLVGEACRELELQHGLRRTPARDGTATRRSTRAEHEKASRLGRGESSRETLRREVRLAAAAANSSQTYFDELRARGVLVKVRLSVHVSDEVTGYAVAWPGDRNRDGAPVWFSGSRLSDDLSLPRLLLTWRAMEAGTRLRLGDSRPGVPERVDTAASSTAWREAARAVRAATQVVDSGRAPRDELVAIALAASTLLLTVARAVEGTSGGPLTTAADADHRGAGRGRRRESSTSLPAARLLAAARVLAHDDQRFREGARPVIAAHREVLEFVEELRRLTGPRQGRPGIHEKATPTEGHLREDRARWARLESYGGRSGGRRR